MSGAVPTAPLFLWEASCPAPWVPTLTGVAISMEQIPRGAEAAVGAREVEAVMEANLRLGAGLVDLAFIHIYGGQSEEWPEVPLPPSLGSLPPSSSPPFYLGTRHQAAAGSRCHSCSAGSPSGPRHSGAGG